jgi:hypothetical protein
MNHQNHESLVRTLLALHCPEAQADSMVYIVFEDGEVCLTKGGDLFMHRSLHCQVPGAVQAPLPASAMPVYYGEDHGYLVARGRLEALAASALIVGPDGHAQWCLDRATKDAIGLQVLLH